MPGTRRIARDFADADPVREAIPVRPAQHYSMGGAAVDVDGRTTVPGLYAAGECACVSVHGANRLGGNSLLEAAVFGRIAGRTAAAEQGHGEGVRSASLLREKERVEALFREDGPHDIASLRAELRDAMSRSFGIFRDGEGMRGGLERVRAVRHKVPELTVREGNRKYRQDLVALLELGNMALVAEAVARSAVRREESRGSHYRTDRPERDDRRFPHHSLARLRGNGYAFGTAPVGAKDITALQGRIE